MGFEVFGILNHKGRVDDGGERFIGQVATARSCQSLIAWKRKNELYVCFLCNAVREVLTWLYWLYLLLTSLSMLEISCKQVQRSKKPIRIS